MSFFRKVLFGRSLVLAIMAFIMAVMCCNVVCASDSSPKKVKKITAKGDEYFAFCKRSQQVLWTLQRRYPTYTRLMTTDVDGNVTIDEDADEVVRKYLFDGKRYAGSETVYHGYSANSGKDLLESVLKRYSKIFKCNPQHTDADWSWTDAAGTEARVYVLPVGADSALVVSVRSKVLLTNKK